MRKILCVIVCLIAAGASSVLAQDSPANEKKAGAFALGGGALFSGNFSYWGTDEVDGRADDRYDTTAMQTGVYGLFDAKYAELNIGVILGRINDSDASINTMDIRFGLYGKVPISVSKTVTLFPLLGVEYDLYLLAQQDGSRRHPKDAEFAVSDSKSDAHALEALSNLGFKAGLGIDVSLTERLFLRTELLYGIRLPNNTEKYLLDKRSDAGYVIGHGGDFKLAVGYRF
jgi:hypothetical protein